MKFSDEIHAGDIEYRYVKSLIPEIPMNDFIKELVRQVDNIRNIHSLSDITRNFLACLKLLKHYEKSRRLLIPRSEIYQLYNLQKFAPHEHYLRDRFERHYPAFAKTCDMTIVAHRAFVPYHQALQTKFELRYHPDYVEIDVCLCKNGKDEAVALLQHDRFAPSGLAIEHADFSDIPNAITLDQLLQSDCFPKQRLMIDIKGSSTNTQIIDSIAESLITHSFPTDNVLMASFNMCFLLYLHNKYPHYTKALITANTALDDFIPFLHLIDCNLIVIDENSASTELISRYHNSNISVWVYTVNVTGRFSSIAKMGAAGIITDYPNLLL